MFGAHRTSFFIFVLILLSADASAQSLSGTVTDRNGAPIAKADVSIRKGQSTTRTTTSADGRFSLPLTSDDVVLSISALGFADYERPTSQTDLSVPLAIILEPAGVREDVRVSITRSESHLSETAASVVALTRKELASTAAQTLDDSLRQIAGFTLFRRGSSKTTNPTAQGANLRGVSGSGASRAAVLLDGVSLNDAFGGWTYWSRVPQIAVEQAEVLRGGASSFYGTSALTGAVNLLTPRADDGPIFRAQTSTGSQGTYDGSLYTAATKHGWGFDLAGETFQTLGYIPVDIDQRGQADTQADSRHNNLLFGLERRFKNFTGVDGPDSARVFLRGNIFAERRDNGTSLTYNRTYFRQAVGGMDLPDSVVGLLQVRASVETQVYDQTFSSVSTDRNSETLTRLQRVPSQAFGGSLFWSRVFGDHAIAGSFEFRDVRGFSNEVGYSNGRATSLSGAGGRQRTYSVFAQDIWRVSDRFNINIGGRVDRWSNLDAASTTRSLTTNVVTVTRFADRGETAFSPRVAALYSVNEHASFYASYSRSFRAPTLNELYRAFRVGSILTLANENLSSENADTVEGGLSSEFLRGRIKLRGNAFATFVSDPVMSVTLSTTPTLITRQRQNVGQTRTVGFEFDLDYAPITQLNLSAGYLFADSRVTRFPATSVLVGKFLPQIPRQQVTLQLSYHPRNRFSASVQARISDGQFEDDLNTLRLRPYFTVDAMTAYRFKKGTEVFAATENLFNTRYDIGLTPIRTVAAPRFVRIGLRFDLAKR